MIQLVIKSILEIAPEEIKEPIDTKTTKPNIFSKIEEK